MNAAAVSQASTAKTTPERLLRRIEWLVIRRLDGLLQGDYRTLFYGDGIDFADLREYQPPDDIRHIDWNVTARMNAPYVRQFVEDREITAWFLLDLSPSMAFGPLDRPKGRVLVDLVTTLARLLTRSGNRVGAILYGSKVEKTLPPWNGRSHVLRLVHELMDGSYAASGGQATDLSVLLQAGMNTIKRRSLVFVISDFISEPGWSKPLSLLNRRHELVAIRLWDPRENELPDAGMIVMEDSETGEQLLVDTSNPAFRRNFLEATLRREIELDERFRQAGAESFAVSTEQDLVKSLVQMAQLRKRRFLAK